MRMPVLTLTTILIVVYGLVSRRYDRALALGGATPAGVAITAGTVGVPTFSAVALAVPALLMAAALRRSRDRSLGLALEPRRPIPGMMLLLGFFVWSLFVTLLAPIAFDGLVPASATGNVLSAGTVTPSNIAQLTYLLLGICVVAYLARLPHTGPEIIGLSLAIAIGLSTWRLVSTWTGLFFPEGVFDNSPTYNFIETAPGGALRFRGIFSEPSALAGVALVAVAYGVARAAHVRGLRRWGCLLLAGVSVYLGILSTSTTFIVAGGIIAAIALVALVLGFIARRTRVGLWAAIAASAIGVAAIWVVPLLVSLVTTLVEDKVNTSSFEDRSGSDTRSLEVLMETFGMGAGLGANRGSAFLPSLLGATGVIGAVLLFAAIVVIAARAVDVPIMRPAIWSLVAVIVAKLIAGPDLSDPTGALWICLGLLAGAGLRARAADATVNPVDAVTAVTTVTAPTAPSARVFGSATHV